jgi:ferredoxin-like protein FixX
MAVWFLRGLRRGVITTRYPKAIDSWTASLPTPPAFDARRLTPAVADRLVDVCPSGALIRDYEWLVLDLGACTACGRCIAVSRGVARSSGAFELSTTERGRLIKRIRLRDDVR